MGTVLGGPCPGVAGILAGIHSREHVFESSSVATSCGIAACISGSFQMLVAPEKFQGSKRRAVPYLPCGAFKPAKLLFVLLKKKKKGIQISCFVPGILSHSDNNSVGFAACLLLAPAQRCRFC